MQFSALTFLAFVVTGVIAAPTADEIFGRANCNDIIPACNGGSISGQTDCRCSGQDAPCDVWHCPGPAPNVAVCGQYNTGCVRI
ncbi:hypothetical protein BKA64DRAFT_742035 [Cadophora sp. MPI-SDFR-AT-0126]|nr:hypothetical protein BKA64DRAFT_742035 [Leotiomycetes sp. MPI-SDFR-AT-0126]